MRRGLLALFVCLCCLCLIQPEKSFGQASPKKRTATTRASAATPVALTLPDLVITDDGVHQDEMNVTAIAKITNAGRSGASFQTGQVMAKLAAIGKTYTVKAPGGGVYIAPGETADISSGIASPVPGTYSVTWTANPDHVVSESNYANNEKACELVIVNALSDLVVSNITATPVSGTADTTFEFAITVTNQGNWSTNNCQGQACQIRIDDAPGNIEARWGTCSVLEPGQSIVHKVRTKRALAAGSHTFKASVDPSKYVTELNEDNNEATINFAVAGKAVAAKDPGRLLSARDILKTNTPAPPRAVPMLPDLVVSQITASPASGPPGTIFEFTIVVTNQGNAIAPKGITQLCELYLDSYQSGWEAEYHWAGYRDLNPGESLTHTLRLKNPLAVGNHTMKAVVDYCWELTEKDETNNAATVSFTVSQ